MNRTRRILALYGLFITLKTLALAETYAGKSSFAAGTSVIVAFRAVAEDGVFFWNWSQAFNWQQKFIGFLEAKGSWIKDCKLMGGVIVSPSDTLHSRLYGCAVVWHGWLGEADRRRLLYCGGKCSPSADPLLCTWCSVLRLAPNMPHRMQQNHQCSLD